MAQCIDCGTKIGFFSALGRCDECSLAYDKKLHEKFEAEKREAEEKKAAEVLAVEAVLLTTETVVNLPIVRRIEIVTAECAFGMNIFKDLFAGVRDIVGGRSEAIQSTMRDARRSALFELKREAHRVGANAVVGVDLDYVDFSSGNMVMLVASGTAVEILVS